MWPLHRIHTITESVDPTCPRCGTEPETALHQFWTCPCNDKIKDEAVAKSQRLISAAIKGSEKYPCMWLRGILPASKTQIPQNALPPDGITIRYVSPPYVYGSGKYYGDASGGCFSSVPSLRRCGCAVVQIDEEGELIHSAYFPLPGHIQTVPRAELFCLVWLVQNAEQLADLHYVTDNDGLYKCFNKGPAAGAVSSNADLYRTLFNTIYQKNPQGYSDLDAFTPYPVR